MNPAERILTTLARFLTGPVHLRLMGGAALILGYGLHRSTEDVDALHRDEEVEAMIAAADFGEALAATNRALEEEGLYFSHIWGPEQQILTPNWERACRPVARDWGSPHLEVSVLGPLDLVLSKLCRADDGDLADIAHIIQVECLGRPEFDAAVASAVVPEAFRSVFEPHAERARALFDRPTRSPAR